MRTRTFVAAAALSLSLFAVACGSSSPASTTATTAATTSAATSTPGAVDPNAPEVVAPGDIPDNQAFVTYQPPGSIYSVDVPEGWSRTETNGTVTFTDKFNSITMGATKTGSPPTVASLTKDGLTDVSADPSFKLVGVKPVTRRAGDGVLATYEIGSAPNSVTGKKALLSVERYEFFHNGTTVRLDLSGAKGADNVDPWKRVTDSLTWK